MIAVDKIPYGMVCLKKEEFNMTYLASEKKSGKEVTLAQMLEARERRAFHQKELLSKFRRPLLSFTMNIAGPVKNSELIRRGFAKGLSDLRQQLTRQKAGILFEEVFSDVTGNEAFLVVDIDGKELKELSCELEDQNDLGRLYDMDVLVPSSDVPFFSRKLDRTEIGKPHRVCLICGAPAKECASRRLHSVEELQAKTESILKNALLKQDAVLIAGLAVRSLLYEVSVTPKPGLVDRANNGSHRDMNFYSFLNSASALWPYFHECVRLGQEYTGCAPELLPDLFTRLRLPGKLAENEMLYATGGVNTHKGAIFSMGILCAALGAALPSQRKQPEEILKLCSLLTNGITTYDYAGLTKENARTAGQRFYVMYGITGIRGEMENGLPVVSQYGLPLLEQLLSEGKSEDEAGAAVLLTIMAHMTDTNLIARSDLKTQKAVSAQAQKVIEADNCPGTALLGEMNEQFMEQNLSPGGSADLLAVCWMLHFVKEEPLLH